MLQDQVKTTFVHFCGLQQKLNTNFPFLRLFFEVNKGYLQIFPKIHIFMVPINFSKNLEHLKLYGT